MSQSMTPPSSVSFSAMGPVLKLSVAISALMTIACSSATYVDEDLPAVMPSLDDSAVVADCPSVCEASKDCPGASPTPSTVGCERYCEDLAEYNELSNCSSEFDALLVCHANATDICGSCNLEKGAWVQCTAAGPQASPPGE